MEKECGLKECWKCEKERKIIGLSLCPDDGRTKTRDNKYLKTKTTKRILKPRQKKYLKTKTTNRILYTKKTTNRIFLKNQDDK